MLELKGYVVINSTDNLLNMFMNMLKVNETYKRNEVVEVSVQDLEFFF